MGEFESVLRTELALINTKLAGLQERKAKIEALLPAPVPEAAAPKKAKGRGKKVRAELYPNGLPGMKTPEPSAKPKGWPKGMPRNKTKRAEWLTTAEGQSFLNAAGFGTAEAYWARCSSDGGGE